MKKQITLPKYQLQNSIQWFSWSVSVAVAYALLVNIPEIVIGQSPPPQSAEQKAVLEEAEQLNQQIVQLYKEGKYSTAIPLAAINISIQRTGNARCE